jgi:toxin ParE1/3/4
VGNARKSSQTNRDLITIADHIAADSPSAAYRFFEAAERSFELLAVFPRLGAETGFSNPILANARLFPIRGFDQYLIIYQPEDDGVFILRVVHGARDLDELIENVMRP